jgi:hypothetical protein
MKNTPPIAPCLLKEGFLMEKRTKHDIILVTVTTVLALSLEGFLFHKCARRSPDPNASFSFPESVRFVSEDGNISFDTRFADHALPEEGSIALTEWFASGAGIINEFNGEKVACRFQKTPYNRCTCTAMEIRDGYVYPNDYAVWFEAENESLDYVESEKRWKFVCEPFAVFDMTHWKDEAQYKIDATKRVFTDDAITFYGSLIEPKPF